MTPDQPETPLVVLADHDEDRGQGMAGALRAAGYRVLAVGTGRETLDCCRAVDPDVILVDADLDGDGLVLLTQLRTDRRCRRVPVVTFSEDAGVEPAVRSLGRGARDHVRGPVTTAEVVARVDALLRVADEHERLRRRNEELEYLGATDDLTGLANRRHIEDELDRLAAAAARHHQPLAAVLLAVDRWDEVEAHGQEAADAVLQEIAVLIGAIRRTDDLAGRFSPETFLVLLPMTAADGATVFAQRVQAVVGAAPITTDKGRIDVSISAGCADGASGPSELLQRAQQALTQAQAGGGSSLVSLSS